MQAGVPLAEDGPRIVSLLPSATELVVAAGRGEALVGRSHECDFPPFVEALPVCTATKLERGLTSRQVEDRVQEIVRQGLSIYEVHAQRLRVLKPDVIITQTQCAVCAVTPADLDASLASWVGAPPVLLSLAPETLDDVWGDLRRVGEAIKARDAAEAAVGELQRRFESVRARGAGLRWRRRVACIEWIDPPMAAGNWAPELVQAAGGEALFAVAGQHSPWLAWEDLAAADPDVIVLMPCGYRIARTLEDLPALSRRPGWRDFAAVRAGRVYATDGHHYFNRPGPRLVESAEILAAVFDHASGGPSRPDGRWIPVQVA